MDFPSLQRHPRSGYIYARGTLDNKWQVAANIMTMLMFKRANVALDRDVIFAAEAGEEASTGPGIEYLVARTGPRSTPRHASRKGAASSGRRQVRFASSKPVRNATRRASWCPPDLRPRFAPMRTSAIFHLARPSKRSHSGIRPCASTTPPDRISKNWRPSRRPNRPTDTTACSTPRNPRDPRVSSRARTQPLLHAAHFDFAEHHHRRLPGQRDSVAAEATLEFALCRMRNAGFL